jgi:hypothetical protein
LGEKVGADIDNEDRVRVLGVVDKLRELGVSDDISLPQVSTVQPEKRPLTGIDRCYRRPVKREIVLA